MLTEVFDLEGYYQKYKEVYDKVIGLTKKFHNDNVYKESLNKYKTSWA